MLMKAFHKYLFAFIFTLAITVLFIHMSIKVACCRTLPLLHSFQTEILIIFDRAPEQTPAPYKSLNTLTSCQKRNSMFLFNNASLLSLFK